MYQSINQSINQYRHRYNSDCIRHVPEVDKLAKCVRDNLKCVFCSAHRSVTAGGAVIMQSCVSPSAAADLLSDLSLSRVRLYFTRFYVHIDQI